MLVSDLFLEEKEKSVSYHVNAKLIGQTAQPETNTILINVIKLGIVQTMVHLESGCGDKVHGTYMSNLFLLSSLSLVRLLSANMFL